MALVQFGAFITEIRGKIGDVLYSRNRGGSYVRNIGTLTDAASASQLEIRNFLTLGVQFWQKMTTDCQLSWTMYAQTRGYKINYYHSGVVAGYNAFLSAFIAKCVSDGFPFNNKVLNGGFSSSSDWFPEQDWSIGSGVALKANGVRSWMYQIISSLDIPSYHFYQFEIKTLNTLGVYMYSGGSTAYGNLYGGSVGVHSTIYKPSISVSDRLYFRADASVIATIDNIFLVSCDQYPSDLL